MNGTRPFRFFDNREKYLLFVTTCGEKWAISERTGNELPEPPALRVFDAGTGDGTVMAGVLRQPHEHFPTVPFLVVGKEISLEDVRLALEKLPNRFPEHPQTTPATVPTASQRSPAPQCRRPSAGSGIGWVGPPRGVHAGRASTIFDTPSRCAESCAGTRTVPMSTARSWHWQPTSATPRSPIPTVIGSTRLQ